MKDNLLKYHKRYLTMVFGLLLGISAYAQTLKDSTDTPPWGEKEGGVLHSTLYGVGASNVLDTYLSPYNFTGIDVRLIRETMRPTKMMNGDIYYQTLIDIDGGYTRNRTKNAKEWIGGIRYANSWMYGPLPPKGGSHPESKQKSANDKSCGCPPPSGGGGPVFYAGLQPSAYLGGIYNTRNSNNPAQAKFDIMINLTGMAEYNLKLFHRVFPIRYQLTVPLVGAAFSMNYGQSYYECFCLGDYDHNVVFANIVNMPSMRHLLTLDIPIRRNYLRVGWSGEFNQGKFNGLRYHNYSNNFMIGFTKFFYRK